MYIASFSNTINLMKIDKKFFYFILILIEIKEYEEKKYL